MPPVHGWANDQACFNGYDVLAGSLLWFRSSLHCEPVHLYKRVTVSANIQGCVSGNNHRYVAARPDGHCRKRLDCIRFMHDNDPVSYRDSCTECCCFYHDQHGNPSLSVRCLVTRGNPDHYDRRRVLDN